MDQTPEGRKADDSAPFGVVIVGGGMAGSLLALVLARAGRQVCIIDPQREPASEFRNEKLGIDQIRHLESLGVLSCFQEACWGVDAVVDGDQSTASRTDLKDCGARYDRWIERIRAAWPSNVAFVVGKADHIETSDDLQSVTLAGGGRITARLVVLATGRGERLRAGLGIRRRIFSDKHSICLGFSIRPREDGREIKAQIVNGRLGDRLAYVTVFPMLGEVRVNVFSYREHNDPWVKAMREAPLATLAQTVPQLAQVLADTDVVRKLEVRSTDLYETQGHVRPGVVLLGDAYHAPCPASGTGMTRILNDVDRLANVHLPRWLNTPGMGRGKIAAFYADRIKRRVDRISVRRSLRGRASTISTSPYWRVRRRLKMLKRS